MKNLLLLCILTIYANATSQEFIKKHNYETKYSVALEKAKQQNKTIMLILSTKTCPWCRKLERQTLKKDFIDDIVQRNFIPIALNRDTDSFPMQFKAKVVPTIYFINPKDERSIFVSYGYKNKRDFKNILLEVKTK